MGTYFIVIFSGVAIPTKYLIFFWPIIFLKPTIKSRNSSGTFNFLSMFCSIIIHMIYSKKFNSRFSTTNTRSSVSVNSFQFKFKSPILSIVSIIFTATNTAIKGFFWWIFSTNNTYAKKFSCYYERFIINNMHFVMTFLAPISKSIFIVSFIKFIYRFRFLTFSANFKNCVQGYSPIGVA